MDFRKTISEAVATAVAHISEGDAYEATIKFNVPIHGKFKAVITKNDEDEKNDN